MSGLGALAGPASGGPSIGSVALLPYNASAAAKYEWLGLPYELDAEPGDVKKLFPKGLDKTTANEIAGVLAAECM